MDINEAVRDIKTKAVKENHVASMQATEEVVTDIYDFCIRFLEFEQHSGMPGLTAAQIRNMNFDMELLKRSCALEIIYYLVEKYKFKEGK